MIRCLHRTEFRLRLFIKSLTLFIIKSLSTGELLRNFFLAAVIFCMISQDRRIEMWNPKDWSVLDRGQVTLHCSRKDIRNGEKIIGISEKVIPRIADLLELPETEPIRIVLAPSQEIFDRLPQGQIPDWGAGAADPVHYTLFLKSPRVYRADGHLEQILAHELSHVLMGMATRGKGTERWFDEGFAQYASGEKTFSQLALLGRAVLTGEFLPLDEIENVLTFRREKASLAYDFLVDRFGQDAIARIAQAIGSGETMNRALSLSVGLTRETFQEQWFADLNQKYRWYVLLDVRAILSVAFVVLFLTAYIVTRRRNLRKKREWFEAYGEGEMDAEDSPLD